MGYYKKHLTLPLPEPALLKDLAWVDDDADTNFSALEVTGRAVATPGKLSTGELTVGTGGTMSIGFCLDSIFPSLGTGVFSSGTPTDGFKRMPFGVGLAIAKITGDTGGGGTTTFTTGTASATTAGAAAIKATATLSFTGVGVDTQTFTVNDQTYTLVALLFPDTAGNILIGANQTETCDNIVSAIMGTAGAGTTYGTGTAAPTGVNSAVRSSDTVVFTATTAGTAANSFVSTETCTNASFGGATFSGGAAATTRVVTGSETFTTTGPVNATTATLLSALTQLTGTLDNGLDTISLGGKTPNNTNWSGTYTYATGDTLATLCARIAALINAAQAASVTCTITSGKIVITDAATGASSTALTTLTFNDIAAGSYVSEIRLDKVTGTSLTRTTVATFTGGPWLVGAISATATAIPLTCTPTLVEAGSLELVVVLTLAASDTAEFEFHAIPGNHYVLADLEGVVR